MRTLLGIDIGTSSLKAMLLNIESGEMYVKRRKYSVSIPEEELRGAGSRSLVGESGRHL